MIIRQLKDKEFEDAIDLKVSCWDEELAGVAPNRIVKKEELDFFVQWLNSAEENNDIRLVYGAFENDKFMGFVGASIAEVEDIENKGIELNYLFVKEEYRGKGISLKLINKILEEFIEKGFEKLVVYNHHYAPSNTFYRKFGAKVLRKDIQGEPEDKLLIDVFIFEDIKKLRENINYVR